MRLNDHKDRKWRYLTHSSNPSPLHHASSHLCLLNQPVWASTDQGPLSEYVFGKEEGTYVGLSTKAEVFPSHFPSDCPEVVFPLRKLISAWQRGRYCGIQRKWKRQIFSSQDAYKMHSYETADAKTQWSRWICRQMEVIMGNWKMSVNRVNQGRLPRGGGLQ